MLVFFNPIHPLVNVVRFSDPVGRQSSAIAMMASVGHQNAIMIIQKPLAVTVHPKPIVGDAMQKNYRVSVWFSGTHKPTAKDYSIRGCQFRITKFYRIVLGGGTSIVLLGFAYRRAGGM
jgi:hypothetical protein